MYKAVFTSTLTIITVRLWAPAQCKAGGLQNPRTRYLELTYNHCRLVIIVYQNKKTHGVNKPALLYMQERPAGESGGETPVFFSRRFPIHAGDWVQ